MFLRGFESQLICLYNSDKTSLSSAKRVAFVGEIGGLSPVPYASISAKSVNSAGTAGRDVTPALFGPDQEYLPRAIESMRV